MASTAAHHVAATWHAPAAIAPARRRERWTDAVAADAVVYDLCFSLFQKTSRLVLDGNDLQPGARNFGHI
jgi:hypothetical protein